MEDLNLPPTLLLVTAVPAAHELAEALSERVHIVVELARSRRAALAALRRTNFDVLLVDAALPEGEVTPTQMLWQNAECALPLEIDLSVLDISAAARMLNGVLRQRNWIGRELRNQVANIFADELRGPITGLLLQSDLVLREPGLSPSVEAKVREIRSLAEDLRLRLRLVR